MITQSPTPEMLSQWKSVWLKHKNQLKPNRKTGTELLAYLQTQYILTEIFDEGAARAIVSNVTLNKPFAEKLPLNTQPVPRAFYLENEGKGKRFYLPQNKDPIGLWGGDITRIFVGVDTASGFYMVFIYYKAKALTQIMRK